jgi:hypothetical protein
VDVAVDADDDALAVVDLGLQLEGGVGDLALRIALLHGVDHAAELVDPAEVVVGLGLELVGERLDEVRPAQRIGGRRDAGLMGDDLLGAQRDAHGVLRR